jgi:hypothetical protein
MRIFAFWRALLLTTWTIILSIVVNGQSAIKINGGNFNHLDRKGRKQGDWIFFDKKGFVRLTCIYKDDHCISPQIFYENSDTAFIKYPVSDSIQNFELFYFKTKYNGVFQFTADRTITLMENLPFSDSADIVAVVEKYNKICIEPVYYFSQKKLIDYISASFSSSRFIFNKPIVTIITINSSGLIKTIEFPREKNSLSQEEESELHWLFSSMPRWQPYFEGNSARNVKLEITHNSSVSVTSSTR